MNTSPDVPPVRAVIADDERLMREQLRARLTEVWPALQIVAEVEKLGADGVFTAREVLAKHDENYMPPEAASALERAQKAQTSAAQTLQPAGK